MNSSSTTDSSSPAIEEGPCPHCGGSIKSGATICKHCREAVVREPGSTTSSPAPLPTALYGDGARAPAAAAAPTPRRWLVALSSALLLVVMFLRWIGASDEYNLTGWEMAGALSEYTLFGLHLYAAYLIYVMPAGAICILALVMLGKRIPHFALIVTGLVPFAIVTLDTMNAMAVMSSLSFSERVGVLAERPSFGMPLSLVSGGFLLWHTFCARREERSGA